MKKTAIVLDPSDTVATVLADVETGETIFLKGIEGHITAASHIAFGHKIALAPIPSHADIVKYGQKIGFATADIPRGGWVHLQNMSSALDAGFRERIGR